MENKLAQVFQIDSEEWLATLPKYQQIRIKELVNFSNSYEEAAQQWLNAMPENTFPLGAEPAKNVLIIEKVRDEIEKFLSGHEKYAEEQKQLVSSSEELQKNSCEFSFKSNRPSNRHSSSLRYACDCSSINDNE